MRQQELLAAVDSIHERWNTLIDEMGVDGLEKRPFVGEWSVRDVVAHANCWDRWQIVQLRCAFTGETPTDAELHGEITFPPNDDMHEDAMNAMFLAGYADWPTEDVVRHFREVCQMRADWVRCAPQDQLDAMIGSDWSSGDNRIVRLASEVDGLAQPQPASEFVMNQVRHLEGHLNDVTAAL